VSKGLVALSSAAILTVYAAGYLRTQAAASDIAVQDAATSAPTRSVSVAPTPQPQTPAQAPGQPNRRGGAGASGGVGVPGGGAAPGPIASPTPAAPAAGAYRDGTYVATGTSRHGNIEATVVIQGGKIVSAEISQCLTRYPCSYIAALPGQVVARQAAKVDVVSRATDSSVAYRAAVAKALAQAQTA
jgi:uncharacterized protein with FMN-binding domain